MKILAITLSATVLFLSSCSDNSADSKNNSKGSEQVQDPVMNSGSETEQERATDAVRDSTVHTDSTAQSMPH